MHMPRAFVALGTLLLLSTGCALWRHDPDHGYADREPVFRRGSVSLCCSPGTRCIPRGDAVVLEYSTLEDRCEFVPNTAAGRNACLQKGGELYVCADIGTTCGGAGCTCAGGKCPPIK